MSGSLRKNSYNTALVRTAQQLAPEGMTIEMVSLDGLPVFNQDIEDTNFPPLARELREKIRATDGVLIAVPEFNRGPASSLKNFLDWSSRPESEPLPWEAKPVAIFGVSSGVRGASFAQYDVRRTMGYFNARVMGQPEVYVGPASQRFNENLELTDEKTKDVVTKFLATFKKFVETIK
jgi:chromate reductase